MKPNPMREPKLEKVVLHCSSSDETKLNKCVRLLEFIAKQKPVMTLAKKRIPAWKIRPGLLVGCKVTLRKQKAFETLRRIFEGIKPNENCFTQGQLAFGVKEYIEIPSIPFQRDLGILGFDVLARLERRGFRVEKRKRARGRIPRRYQISKAETLEFFKKRFKLGLEK